MRSGDGALQPARAAISNQLAANDEHTDRLAPKGSLRNFNLNALPVFEVLINEQNLSRAADILGMSQSAVSHALAKLRVQFGDPLFVRSKGGVEPTAKAIELSTPIALALDVIRRELLSGGLRKKQAIGPRFQCGLVEPLDEGPVLVAAIMQALRENAASAALSLSAVGNTDWKKMLRLRKRDLVFDHKPAVERDLDSELISNRKYACYVRQENPISEGGLTLARYLEARHVIMEESGQRSALQHALAAANMQRIIGAHVHTQYHAALVVSQSDLVGTGYREDVDYYARNFRFRVFDCPAPINAAPLHMIWLRVRTGEVDHRSLRQTFARLYRKAIETA
jgi:DNA-binding transcriptional LysR family regulator